MVADNTVTELWKLSLTELSAGFKALQFKPSELCEQLLTLINDKNGILNAYVYLNPQLLSQAKESDLRWQQKKPLSEFDGIAIGIKDNINVAGMPTSWGNGGLKHNIATDSEWTVKQCQSAGMLIIGKTNVPEFASEGVTDNPTFGITRNPWEQTLTPGGSSGGMVSAIASGMACAGIGTDGGGSIRRPCAHTGLVGLKPTAELISREGGLPRFMFDFEVAGPIARTVEEVGTLFTIMSAQPFSLNKEFESKLKVLVVTELGEHPVDPDIIDATKATAQKLSQLGHLVDYSQLPLSLDCFEQYWPILGKVGIAYALKCFPEAQASAQDKFKKMASEGADFDALAMMQLWQETMIFRQQVKALFNQWDVILMPSIAAKAWPVNLKYPPNIAGKSVGERGHAIFTGWVNMAGNPAINIPSIKPAKDSLIGVQLIAGWHQEQRLLSLAKQLEETGTGWEWPLAKNLGANQCQK